MEKHAALIGYLQVREGQCVTLKTWQYKLWRILFPFLQCIYVVLEPSKWITDIKCSTFGLGTVYKGRPSEGGEGVFEDSG